MALDLFAVVSPGVARCRQPDARGLRDLRLLGMRVAVRIGGDAAGARLDMEALEGPVIHQTEPLVVYRAGLAAEGEPAPLIPVVDHAAVQALVRELVGHAASKRPGAIYCQNGALETGLVAGALLVALGHHDEAALVEEYTAFCEDARRRQGEASIVAAMVAPGAFHDAAIAYLCELARVSRPSGRP